jgi:hypothetical protein
MMEKVCEIESGKDSVAEMTISNNATELNVKKFRAEDVW